MESLDWGTVPAYFGGIALFLTAWTMIRSQRANVREQANQVAAWVDKVDGKTVILMKNASDLPITSARVEPAFKPHGSLNFAKDDAAATLRRKPIYLPSGVGPEQTVTVAEIQEGEVVRVVGFSFKDARGQEWRRVEGKLIRLGWAQQLPLRVSSQLLRIKPWRKLRAKIRQRRARKATAPEQAITPQDRW